MNFVGTYNKQSIGNWIYIALPWTLIKIFLNLKYLYFGHNININNRFYYIVLNFCLPTQYFVGTFTSNILYKFKIMKY